MNIILKQRHVVKFINLYYQTFNTRLKVSNCFDIVVDLDEGASCVVKRNRWAPYNWS